MPDRCLSETLHHFFHGEWSEAFRRGRPDPVWAGLSGSGVHAWYHAPQIMIAAMASRFRMINVSPIGFFLPPRQMGSRFASRQGTIDRLARWDARMMNRRWAARFSDHYLIDLERTS